ncbi:hypothetical protein AAG570_009360 [Ranatra chinensis]|uniref:Uncharacterized protein n=1 Tax=Ranatra chinensis TaxID=642074 RepID=A0ABD0YNV0_9HEMI
MNFRYGKTYGAAADDSLKNNSVAKALRESKKALETSYREKIRRAPKMLAVKPKEQIDQALLDYTEENKYHDEHISPELPPIAGYTGHIPRVKSSDASLSQRYAVAAKKGLYLLQQSLKAEDGVQAPKHVLPEREAGNNRNRYMKFGILL